jgi:L-asparagine transporter-like permease
MSSLKKMLDERKEAKKQIGVRTPVARVLLTLGFFLIFAVLGIFSLTPAFSLPPSVILPLAAVFLVLLIVFGVHYKLKQTKEQVEKRIKPKTFVETLIFTIILLVFIFIGLSFFLPVLCSN